MISLLALAREIQLDLLVGRPGEMSVGQHYAPALAILLQSLDVPDLCRYLAHAWSKKLRTVKTQDKVGRSSMKFQLICLISHMTEILGYDETKVF